MIVEIIILSLIALILLTIFLVDVIKSKVASSKKKKREKSEINADEENDSGKDMPCALELKDVVKVYGKDESEVHALKGVSVAFRKNEFVSVLGPSGCGKTTMLNIIGGLDRYTSGDLLINGVSTKKFVESDWDTYRNNSIGFVFQSYNLIPHQTVLSNVEMALTLSGIDKDERNKRAMTVLEKVGLKGMENKLPNQMSGGQMQRVAIARALVNNPEIILADEPTGALDTETSVQIMELLKEVAKDRLVIMVTHNPKLAEDYSTRIINLLDGEIKGDTDEFKPVTYVKGKHDDKGKAEMKFSTAFSLSLSNLKTKGGRTVLTSVAGSIGIIGIALVLALSSGFSGYINNLQADTLSTYPITITESTIDLNGMDKLMKNDKLEKFPEAQKIYKRVLLEKMTDMLKNNSLTPGEDGYINYVESYIKSENEKVKDKKEHWKYSLTKGYGFDVNNFLYSEIDFKKFENKVDASGNLILDSNGNPIPEETKQAIMPVDTLVQVLEGFFDLTGNNIGVSSEFVRKYIPTISEMPNNMHQLQSQYDLLEGEWATEEDELMLVVDTENKIYDITLAVLGMIPIEGFNSRDMTVKFGEINEFTFEDIMQKEFYYIPNNSRYINLNSTDDTIFLENIYKPQVGTNPVEGTTSLPGLRTETNPDGMIKLKIKGIIRRSPDVNQGVLDPGIAYTSKFVDRIIADNLNSEIATVARENNGVKIKNPMIIKAPDKSTGGVTTSSYGATDLEQLTNYLKSLKSVEYSSREVVGSDVPNNLSIYSATYDDKEEIKSHLNAWNDERNNDEHRHEMVFYADSTEMMFYALNTMVDSSKIVLIAFTAISLIVSSIMIGIITYVSVVERTKEIGVLRSLGARKKDISRIFNAETFLIGLFAGLIGIGVTYLLSIPINLIMGHLVAGLGTIANLRIIDAVFLVAISFVLTLIAGVIPSRIAANKDPVEALRSN